jgi:hypothetical protein
MSQTRITPERFIERLLSAFSDDSQICKAAANRDYAELYRLLCPYSKWPHGNRWLGRRGAPVITPDWLLQAEATSQGRMRMRLLLIKYSEGEWMVPWLERECRRLDIKLRWPPLFESGDYLVTAV